MSKKPKFKPEITRVKLNPEQAVLTCDCYDQTRKFLTTFTANASRCCSFAPKANTKTSNTYTSGTATTT